MGKRGGDRQQGWRGLMARRQMEDGSRQFHICVQINRNYWGARQTTQPHGSSLGKQSLKPLIENTCEC